MNQQIVQVALLVKDYDEALTFYTQQLGFTVLNDTLLEQGKRWVVVAPVGAGECGVLLAKAVGEEQLRYVGSQTGGRVFLFLKTDDFWRDYNAYADKGIRFVRPPKVEAYGTVAVFEDLYGNLWDLIQFSDREERLKSGIL